MPDAEVAETGYKLVRRVERRRQTNPQFTVEELEPRVMLCGDATVWVTVNVEFYRHVEWALDISKGEFKELCIRGLSGYLIRRDPEAQVLITREKAFRFVNQ